MCAAVRHPGQPKGKAAARSGMACGPGGPARLAEGVGRDRSEAHHAEWQALPEVRRPCGAMRFASIAPYSGLRVTALQDLQRVTQFSLQDPIEHPYALDYNASP